MAYATLMHINYIHHVLGQRLAVVAALRCNCRCNCQYFDCLHFLSPRHILILFREFFFPEPDVQNPFGFAKLRRSNLFFAKPGLGLGNDNADTEMKHVFFCVASIEEANC